MDEYIRRDTTLESLCVACEFVPIEEKENCPFRFSKCQEYTNISALPAADVVEVVRCKYCKHWRGSGDICTGIGIDFDGDGFCSEGEMITNG